MAYKRSGRHPGPPNKEERRAAYQASLEAADAPLYGPPVPKGIGWGGKREGSGRPKKEGGALQFVGSQGTA